MWMGGRAFVFSLLQLVNHTYLVRKKRKTSHAEVDPGILKCCLVACLEDAGDFGAALIQRACSTHTNSASTSQWVPISQAGKRSHAFTRRFSRLGLQVAFKGRKRRWDPVEGWKEQGQSSWMFFKSVSTHCHHHAGKGGWSWAGPGCQNSFTTLPTSPVSAGAGRVCPVASDSCLWLFYPCHPGQTSGNSVVPFRHVCSKYILMLSTLCWGYFVWEFLL